MARDEDEFIGLRVALCVREKVGRGVGGLVLIVDAKIADIEVIARELEIIRVASEKGDVFFGRENEPDILKAAIFIKIVNAAIIKRDDIAANRLIAAGAFLRDGRLYSLFRVRKGLTLFAFERGF